MDILKVQGLIGNDLVLYNKIMEAFYIRMSEIDIKSSIFCSIMFGSITMKNSNNCNISIINKCFSNSSLVLNIFLQVLVENSHNIPDNIKKRLEKNLGILLDKDLDQTNKGFMKKCNISAEVSDIINIKKLQIEECQSQIPLEFIFFNTGDAKANCGMIELLQALSNKTEDEENDKDTLYKNFDYFLLKTCNLTLYDCIVISILFFCILTISLFCVLFVKANHLVIYSVFYKFSKIFEKKI